jgi:uncharacterized protein YecE (DUF72 family)
VKGLSALHVGTSGWHYAHWKGPFYPEDLPDAEMLAFYAARFSTVEINNTFYRLPQKETLAAWRDSVPSGFIFSVKASRYITHMKKLTDVSKPLSVFLGTIDVLDDKLGPVLFQLPPRWHLNIERLRTFLSILPKKYRYAFEFRDPSWFVHEVYEALSDVGASFCIYDLAGSLSPKEITSDIVYIRLHGPDGPYRGRYRTEDLADWLRAFAAWRKQKREIYCYFDNDEAGYAAGNALELCEMTMGD